MSKKKPFYPVESAELPAIIKNYIIEQEQRDDYEPMPNNFAITELLYCLRKTCLKRSLGPKPIQFKQAINFYRGNVWDKEFTRLFKRNQIRCTYRCRNVPLSISGRFDFLDEDPPVITDLKSPATLYWTKEKGTSDQYVKQVMFYCFCNAINKGRLGFWDGSEYLQHTIEATDEQYVELIEYIEGRAAVLFCWMQTGKLPSVEVSTPEDWECRTCDYKEECEK